MHDDISSAQGSESLAVVSFPERVDVSNAGWLRDKLLTAISHGAVVVIADMSATAWCDHAGADVLARAYQRTLVNGTQLRLVVTDGDVRELVSADGLDRLMPVYASLESAVADGIPDAWADAAAAGMPLHAAPVAEWPVSPRPGQGNGSVPAAMNPLVLRQLIDALDDGVALTDAGRIILANRRLAEMFGYQQGELEGQAVEALIPAGLRAAHREYRAGYARKPVSRPMGQRARLVGLAKNGGTVPVTITLSPVPTADRHFILAVIRSATQAVHRDDLTDLVWDAVAGQARHTHDLLDRVVNGVFHVGLSLQTAIDMPAETARERLTDALQRLDDTVHEIRDHVFRTRDR